MSSSSTSSRRPSSAPLGQSVRLQWDFYTNFRCLRRRRRRSLESETLAARCALSLFLSSCVSSMSSYHSLKWADLFGSLSVTSTKTSRPLFTACHRLIVCRSSSRGAILYIPDILGIDSNDMFHGLSMRRRDELYDRQTQTGLPRRWHTRHVVYYHASTSFESDMTFLISDPPR